MAKQTVLLVDGDRKSLRILEISLRKAGFSVMTAGEGLEALAKVEASPPALIIADTRLPGLDGFDFCRKLKERREWASIPFLFLTGEVAIADKVRGLELGVEDYLTKPIFIREVLTRVRLSLQRKEHRALAEHVRQGETESTRFRGQLADLALADLIQLFESSGKSGAVWLARTHEEGVIFFRDGRPVDAEVGRLAGAEAVYRALLWPDGEFDLEFRAEVRPDRIRLPAETVLLEGMRRLDEWGRLTESLPPLDSRFEVDYRELADRLTEIPDEVNALLRLFDGERTLLEVVEDSPFGDLETLSVISKLYFEGFLYNINQKRLEDPQRGETAGAVGDERTWLTATRASTPSSGGPAESDASTPPAVAAADAPLARDDSAPQVELDVGPGPAPMVEGQVIQFPAAAGLPRQVRRTAADDLGMVKGEAESPGLAREEAAPESPQVLIDTGLRREIEASGEAVERVTTRTPTSAAAVAPAGEELDHPAKTSRIPLVVVGLGILALVAVALAWLLVPRGKEPRVAVQPVLTRIDAAQVVAPVIDAAEEGDDAATALSDAAVPSAMDGAPRLAAPSGASDGGVLSVMQPPAVPSGAASDGYEELVAQARKAKGRGRQAQALLEKAVEIRPDGEEAIALLARVSLDREQWKKALVYAERAIDQNPKNAEAFLVKGSAAQMLGDKAAARAGYRQYLKLSPKGRDAAEIRHILSNL